MLLAGDLSRQEWSARTSAEMTEAAHLGGQPNLPAQVGLCDCLAHLVLIAVHACRVDVSVARLESSRGRSESGRTLVDSEAETR